MHVLFTLLQKGEGGAETELLQSRLHLQQDIRETRKKIGLQENKNMQYSCHLLCENRKYTNKKNNLICLVFCVLATCSHPYHTWYLLWQGILGRIFWQALSTPVIVQLWYLGMHYPLHPGGTFDPVDYGPKPSTSRLRKTHQRGWSKGRKGE